MNYDEIKKLMDDMGDSKIDSLDIEFPDGIKISMKKNENTSNIVPSVAQNQINVTAQTEIQKQETKSDENLKVITSPMVGTFYESASPKEKPFVKVGDKVKKGDVLCIIEAMKLMNEIESEFDGEIAEVCVNNEEMVDFGKTLFKIK